MIVETFATIAQDATRYALVQGALDIWQKGGWAMYALFGNGLLMFTIGVQMMCKLVMKGVFSSPDRAWQAYWRNPAKPRGMAGQIIAEAMTCSSLDEAERYFEELHKEEVAPFERDLPVMKVTVSAAPLLGLLGTVTGMLATFSALATGGGGEKTMGMIAGGISEALITTMTGLVLALTGLIFQSMLARQHAKFQKLTAHLETLCTQHFRRGWRTAGGRTPTSIEAV